MSKRANIPWLEKKEDNKIVPNFLQIDTKKGKKIKNKNILKEMLIDVKNKQETEE